MATASPSDVVLDLARSREPTLGGGRLVCVDGPAGSGKTTLGRELAVATGAPLVHTDDLMEGWRGLDAVARELAALVADLNAGRPASYRRFDWLHHRYAERRIEVPAGPWLVVEGVGSGAPVIAPHVTVLVWIEVDDELRLARGMARDGEQMRAHWETFMVDERALAARDRTRERAHVLVDGTGARPPEVR